MRKPSKIVPNRTVLAGRAVLVVTALLVMPACQKRDKSNDAGTATARSAPLMLDSAVGGVAGAVAVAPVMAAPPEVMNQSVARDEAMLAAPAAAPAPAETHAEKAMARRAMVGNGQARGDFSLGTPIPSVDATGAMLVRHGQASIEVRGVDAAVVSARQAASQFGGFVANTSLRSGKDEQRSATLELRVPSDKFDALVTALSQLGKVETVTASAEDVGEEYVDLGARAANARKVEARLVEMLATRTGKLSDVLTVEQELARVRMEAERYEARIRYLERRASLSSLDVTLHESIPLIDPQPGPGPLAEALALAWMRMVSVAAWCVAALGVLVPLGLLIGVGIYVARRFRPKGGELVG
jgi:hypothetical protein